MNDNIKDLIGWWKLKGQRERDPFIKFFFFYMCFDAWITAESSEDSDQDKLTWLFSNPSLLRESWKEIQADRVQSLLANLRHYSPIRDMRPGRDREVPLNDIDDFEQVIRFIYQIRCNLFHGSKNPSSSRDSALVELSAEILEKWITWTSLKL